jgi:hypothetical protein
VNIRKAMKVSGWILLGVLAIPVLLYLVTLGINWQDQPPSASVTKLHSLLEGRAPVADDENGYVYVLGFAAESGTDPQELGMRRVDWLREKGYRPGSAKADPWTASNGVSENSSTEIQALMGSCNPPNLKCVAMLESSPELLAHWLGSDAILLERYRALLARDGWLEMVPHDARMPLPAYSKVTHSQRLLFADLWQRSRSSDPATIREALRNDIVFWRRVLASSDLLITKMIATAALRQHFAYGNLILGRLPHDQVMHAVPAEWTQALTAEERSMLRSASGELPLAEATLLDTKQFTEAADDDWYEDQFIGSRLANFLAVQLYQPQDTVNAFAGKYVEEAEAFTVPLDEYPEALERLSVDQAPSRSFRRPYNIVGDMLVDAGGGWTLGTHAVRVSDIEGMRRAALLATELRSQSVPLAELAERLRAASLRSPYDDRPFEWSEEEQAIVFVGLEKGERGRQAYVY